MKKTPCPLSVRWRAAANEATTGDAAATYLECADALDAAIAAKALVPAARVLVAVCEGCGVKIPVATTNPRKVVPDLPHGWSQSGVSRRRVAGHSPLLASWCPTCRAEKRSPAPKETP